MMEFFANQGQALMVAIGEHLLLSFVALALGIIVAVPLGIWLSQVPKIANVVIGIASVLQTIPTLALLTLMVILLGVGKLPSIVALFIYSLLPILRNTYLGISGVDPNLIDAAQGMGMSRMQVIRKVLLALAVPVIMAGIPTAAAHVLAWTTIAAYGGGGGRPPFNY